MKAKILNPKITAGYRIELDSAGYISQHVNGNTMQPSHFGWMPASMDVTATRRYPWQGRNLVATTTDCLFIGSDLAETLGIQIEWGTAELHLGRKTLWAVSAQDIATGFQHNAYPSRSDREAECRRRNIEVLNWLTAVEEAIHAAPVVEPARAPAAVVNQPMYWH